jgi:nitrilase
MLFGWPREIPSAQNRIRTEWGQMAARQTLRAAAIQAAPVFLDPTATVEKAVRLVEEAARGGARLVAFGEGFLPGHPIWLHLHPVTSPAQIALASELVAGAVTIPGPETARLAEVARRTGTMIVMGATERLRAGDSSVALAALVVGSDGEVSSRRKVVPAVGERALYTPGAGDSIRIFESPWGPLSVLLGGENANPLLTWTMRELGARIHVAAWPPHFNKPGVMGETATITARAIAYQNTAHVLSVAGATTEDLREQISRSPEDRALLDAMAADPASAVYAPRGSLVAGPLPGGEGILYADLDLSGGVWPSLVNRQYDRPDLFRVTVDTSPRRDPLSFEELDGRGLAGPAAPARSDPVADRARRLIADRYGDLLDADDAERLVPFVVSVLDTSARLEALDPSLLDPVSPSYADDLRAAR